MITVIRTLVLCSIGLVTVGARAEEIDGFFAGGHVPRISISLADGAADRLREDPRGYVSCTLTIDGHTVHEDVAVKLKGSAGSFQGLDDKPGFTVNMDRFRPGARFAGLDKFHLNNAAQDPTFLHEWLGTLVFLEAGVPAARVTHAHVVLDDRDLGLYVFKEAIDRDFLVRHFADPRGNLYDGGTAVDLDALVERDEGKHGVPGADLQALVAACRHEDPAERQAAIAERLDVEAFITFMALEMMSGHWDGYCLGHNNYRVYVDPGNEGKVRFLPHGMDQLFGDPGAPILEMPATIVASAVMQVPAWREAYRARVRELLPLFDAEERLLPRLDPAVDRIRAAVAAMGEEAVFGWEEAIADLRARLRARDGSLREQAEAPDPEPIQFDGGRRATPAGWAPRTDTGGAQHEELVGDDGRRRYAIIASGDGPCIASWRVVVPLPAGAYLLQGLALGEGIEATEDETGSGAGLRISGERRTNRADSDGTWTPLEHRFTLDMPTSVELVVELRAKAGRVDFNADSLAILRLTEP